MASDGYYRHPTICGDRIVFVSEDDLWSVGLEGGAARRLTASPGTISFPACSADGTLLAFTSRDEGHPEAYVMDAEGGPARRITWMGSLTQVVGWTPDGRVAVASDWKQPFPGYQHLWAVSPEGGRPSHSWPARPERSLSSRTAPG
jgi:tricorn protease